MADHVWRADRYVLDYTVPLGSSGATSVWTSVTDWAADAALVLGNGTVVAVDTPRPLEGRWEFNAPHAYPAYLTGRSYDLHATAADLLEQWAAKVKLEHDLSIGDLRLTRKQKYDALIDLAKNHRKRIRLRSVQIVDESYLASGVDYRSATAPPPM